MNDFELSEDVGYVYFIFGVDKSFEPGALRCKVGWSLDPWKRLKTIQTATPFKVRLIATVENATKADERWYHEYFEGSHIFGEWFAVEGKLLTFLVDNRLIWRQAFLQLHGVLLEGIQEWRAERGLSPYVPNEQAVSA